MANQWFSFWERDQYANWVFMGWLWTNFAAAQVLAIHLEQCRIFMKEPRLRYMIGDIRGDGIIEAMRR